MEESIPPKNQEVTAIAAPSVEATTPYSIAVAPLSSLMKFLIMIFSFYISFPLGI
jgi:hypothetical protein